MSVTKSEYYECDSCKTTSETKDRMCPCPRGGCEAKLKGQITIEKTIELIKEEQPSGPKHTKGPWKIFGYSGQHNESGTVITGPNGEGVCSTNSVRTNSPIGWDEYYANAKLISEAPNMYELIKEFCQRVEKGEVRSTYTYSEFKKIIERLK